MKRCIVIVIICLLISSVMSIKSLKNKESKKEVEEVIENPKKDYAEYLLDNMSLEEKIGQMLIISYRKENMDSNLSNLLNNIKPGGFIFFAENFEDYDTSKKLIEDIKNTSSIPMLLGVDEEGGRVDRFKNMKNYNYEKVAPMLNIGATNNVLNAYQAGLNLAKILNDFNLNIDFAPVIDVYSNTYNTVIGNRSFGSDASLVSSMGLNLAKGLMDSNIIPVYKHFPGHGNTKTDSHYDLPIVKESKEYLLKNDLIPFIDAINNGAEVIMIGHLAVPSITNDYTPASLSKTLITDFLKNELNYQNLVITDALNMQAITKNYSDKETLKLAINAGVDILLMPNNEEKTVDLIKELLTEEKITEEQINTSVLKILNLKIKYNIIDVEE